MKKDRSITKNYLYNVSYKILTLITPLITTPYIARVLGVDNVGIYNYTYSIISYFVLFGVLGSTIYAQREIAYVQNDKEKTNLVFWELFFIRLITVGTSILIFSFYFPKSEYKIYLFIFLFELIANIFDISWLYYGIEEFKVITIRNFIIKIIGVGCIFIFVRSSTDLNIYIWCHVLILLLGNLSLWISAKKFIGKPIFKFNTVMKHFTPILILFLPQCIDSVYMIMDKIMLGKMSTITQVGLYSQADKIIKMAVTIVTSMGLVMSPRIASSFATGDNKQIRRYLHSAFEFIFIIAIPIMCGLVSISDNFVGWFFGEGYEGVIILIKLLAPTVVFLGINSVIGWQYLLSVKREKDFIFSVSIGAIINIILNIILIIKFKAVGAVIASVVSMAIMSIINFIFVKKQISFKYLLSKLYKPLIAAIIMTIIVEIVGKYISVSFISTVIQVIVGIIIYILILFIIKDDIMIRYVSKIKGKKNNNRDND